MNHSSPIYRALTGMLLATAVFVSGRAFAHAPGNSSDSDGCEHSSGWATVNHCNTGATNPTFVVTGHPSDNSQNGKYCWTGRAGTAFASFYCKTPGLNGVRFRAGGGNIEGRTSIVCGTCSNEIVADPNESICGMKEVCGRK